MEERAGSFSGSMRNFQKLDDVDVDIENRHSNAEMARRKLTSTVASWVAHAIEYEASDSQLVEVSHQHGAAANYGNLNASRILSINFYPVQPDPGIAALDPSGALASPKDAHFSLPLVGTGSVFDTVQSQLKTFENAQSATPAIIDVTSTWNADKTYACFNGWLIQSKSARERCVV